MPREARMAAPVSFIRWLAAAHALRSNVEYLELQDVLPVQLPHEERTSESHKWDLIVLRVSRFGGERHLRHKPPPSLTVPRLEFGRVIDDADEPIVWNYHRPRGGAELYEHIH